MDFRKTVFEFIENLIKEGNLKKAAKFLWNIAKNNRMNNLSRELVNVYDNAVELEIYRNANAVDELLATSQEGQLSRELEGALTTIRRKDNIKIVP